jgi:hypothetical protein
VVLIKPQSWERHGLKRWIEAAESARTMGVSVCSLHIRDVKRRATNPARQAMVGSKVIVRGDNLRNANSM